MVVRGPVVKLSNGAEMPLVGLGTWLSEPDVVKNAVRHALDNGYRLIDTAELYKNEAEIGEALAEYLKDGKVKREEIFVTTKLWCTHFAPNEMEPALRESLKKLQLDYVDLYLAHMPGAFNGMEELYKKGLTKAIGVSNFSAQQVERVVKAATVPVHNLQVECHLYFPQFELHETCKRHNISFTAYAPIGSPGRDKFRLPTGEAIPWKPAKNPMEDPLVTKMASEHQKTPAQILLRYLLQRDIAIIPKSVNEKRIKENFDIFDFKLSDDEMKELNTQEHHQRIFFQDL
ncbi:unnamed protein product [Enterobius vermicularis]|uniref:Aldo_ket_red domain-containing protein n=1 Tax=Enterobius vermicularis TaxID=51028 RepID=A0A0N4VHN3_ENTVE|nr:unnamed protein product [Enterobius vermicularis]